MERARYMVAMGVTTAILVAGGVYAQIVNSNLDPDSNAMVVKWANQVFRFDANEIQALLDEKAALLGRVDVLEDRVGVLSGQLADQSLLISRQNFMLNRLWDLGIIDETQVPGGFVPTVVVQP